MRAGPGVPVPDLGRARTGSQVHGGADVRARDGIPVARPRYMAVGLHPPAVRPVRHLVRHWGQRDRQRPLPRFEHGKPGAVALPERARVVFREPFAYRRTQLVRRTEPAVAHRSDQRHGRVPHGVLRRGLVLRPFHPSGQHGRRTVPGHAPVRVVQHDPALTRVPDHAGPEIVAHQTGRGAAEPPAHRRTGPQPRVPRHARSGLRERVPAGRQHADKQAHG